MPFAAQEDGRATDLAAATIGTKIVIGEALLVLLAVEHADGSVETSQATGEHSLHSADTGERVRANALNLGRRLLAVRGDARWSLALRVGGQLIQPSLKIDEHIADLAYRSEFINRVL